MSDTLITQADAWAWWRKALTGTIDKNGLHDGEPQTGYYRVRNAKGSIWRPVAFWYEGSTLRCRLNNVDVHEDDARELWNRACKNPIEHGLYENVLKGEPWPDLNPTVMGHNQAPADDSIEAIRDRLDDLVRDAEKMIAAGAAPDAAMCDQASDIANTLGELETKANRNRTAEKEPTLQAGRDIDAKWKPLIEKASEVKRRLKLLVVTPFLTKKEAERQKTLAAEVAKGTPIEALPNIRTTAGSSKRSTALRTQKSAEIADYPALLAVLSEHPEIKETVQRIANASARAGVALPGMKIIETRVAA